MPALTPQALGPDGVLRTTLVFSTTMGSRFFQGTMNPSTIDMEVSINGSGFSNDSDFILFEGESWVVPNPAAYPEGLDLLSGTNVILVRAIGLSGSVSEPARIEATVVQESDLGVVAEPPTNISVTRKDQSVVIQVEGFEGNEAFQGFNFYASQFSGGGDTGYQRVNLELVTEASILQETEDLSSDQVDISIPVSGNGQPLLDRLFLRTLGQQEDAEGTVLDNSFNTVLEVPDTTTSLRVSTLVEAVRTIQVYKFEHNRKGNPNSTPRTIAVSAFATTPTEDLLYYVVTGVFFDPVSNVEFESSFSQEIVGRPTKVTATVGTFPVVPRSQIVRDYITSVVRSNPQIRVEEGAPLREVVIDPFSTEAERVRFILDFLHRARSPTQLLSIDDPNGTGVSSEVSTTPYKVALKQAFRLTNNADVQALIDAAFETYASNLGVFRSPNRAAQGEVTFFTRSRPTRSILIPLGSLVSGGGQTYRTTQSASIPLNQIASFFNPVTGRYQVTVAVRAVTPGSTGNIGAGQVRRVESAIPGVSVTNSAAMFGGRDVETNLQLVERARNRLSSVDSGTKQGYQQTAADVAGVVRVAVVGAGDPLMQRDLDSEGVHRGGKVDIWIQGTNLATVSDTFAFTFEIAQDIQFTVVGDPTNLEFVAVDPDLSEENPLVEMLDVPEAGFEFRNVSTGDTFNLDGVTITSFNGIQLDTSLVQPIPSLTDVVLGSYRRRVGSTFTLTRQPVTEVVSVTGVVSGQLPDSAVDLFRLEPALVNGRSALAKDFLSIQSFVDSQGNRVPSGELITVTSEPHVLVGDYAVSLNNLGAVFLTVRVFNEDRTVEYRGPNHPSGVSDYTIILGDQTTPLAIRRVEGGDLPSGARVLVDYSHDENFSVVYRTNLVVSTTQRAVDEQKHETADVLVKDAIPVPLDIQATVILNQGRASEDVDPQLRTNLENFIRNLRLGDPVRQSDVVNVIENTSGVSYVVLPLTRMVRQQGSQVVREGLDTDLAADAVSIPSLSTSSVFVWLLRSELSAATINGGGPETEFRGVYQNDLEMELLPGAASLASLAIRTRRAYIIGSSGISIPGYSDDATLIAAGFTSPEQRAERRRFLTANRVLVSTGPGESPVNFSYSVSYIVGQDAGAKDVDPSPTAYITPGDFLFTYDEDQ